MKIKLDEVWTLRSPQRFGMNTWVSPYNDRIIEDIQTGTCKLIMRGKEPVTAKSFDHAVTIHDARKFKKGN